MSRYNCNLIELKLADANTGIMEFTGYGAVFKNQDAHGDVIQPGAFKNYLADVKSGIQDWPCMLIEHGGKMSTSQDVTPIGVWSSIEEDQFGLKVTGILADTPRGNEIHQLMKMQPRPAITGLSIGYITREAKNRSNPSEPKRLLKRIDLVEISPVTFPSNNLSRISGVKSAKDMTEREFEHLLRDVAGLTLREAKTVISYGFKKVLIERDADSTELIHMAALIERNTKIFK